MIDSESVTSSHGAEKFGNMLVARVCPLWALGHRPQTPVFLGVFRRRERRSPCLRDVVSTSFMACRRRSDAFFSTRCSRADRFVLRGLLFFGSGEAGLGSARKSNFANVGGGGVSARRNMRSGKQLIRSSEIHSGTPPFRKTTLCSLCPLWLIRLVPAPSASPASPSSSPPTASGSPMPCR